MNIPPLLLAAVLGAPDAIASVEVVWQGPLDNWPMTGPATARADEDVWLSVLVRFADGTCAARNGAYVDPAGLTRLCDTGLERLADYRAQWHKLEPTAPRHRRSVRGVGEPLPYQTTPYAALDADRAVLADVRPTLLPPDDAPELGAMRFVVTLTRGKGEPVPSPSAPAQAFLMKLRAGDDLPGILQELRHLPHADSPRGVPISAHETEAALAVDGVTLPVYGARRLGLPLPYADLDLLQPHLLRVQPDATRQCPHRKMRSSSLPSR